MLKIESYLSVCYLLICGLSNTVASSSRSLCGRLGPGLSHQVRPSVPEAPAMAAVLHVSETGVATITLNRPEARNTLSAQLVNELGDLLVACMADTQVRVVVLTNAGNTFCAGADLKSTGEKLRYSLAELFQTMQGGSKPIVGRINGHCVGGGVGLAAACDISVIRSDAQVAFSEVRLGVAPAIISVVCLPKLSRRDAAELMLLGEKVSASRVVEAGLLNYCAAPEDVDLKVQHIVDQLLLGGPGALAVTKSLLYRVPGMLVDEAYSWTTEVSQRLFQSEEARAGIAAFARRQKPPWAPPSKL